MPLSPPTPSSSAHNKYMSKHSSPPEEDSDHLPGTNNGGSPPNSAAALPSLSTMPMHMFTFNASSTASSAARSKRRQVKNACTNCQRACKKCDDARPCMRCVKYGVSDDCVDSSRKERKKGVKRGPYKKRDGKSKDCTSSEQLQADPVAPPGFPAGSLMPIMGAPIGFPPFYHGGIPPFVSGGNGKLGDNGPAFVQQIYVMAPPPPQIAQEGGATTYAHSQYYPTAFMPYTQPYHAYMLPHSVARGDGQMITPPPYAYQPSYGKMVSVEPASNDHNSRRNT